MTIIANRYDIQQEIGQGGMGNVYLAVDTHTDEMVAVKHLRSNLTDLQLIERFRREGEALRDLNHPNIVKLLDTIEENDSHYLVMEYVSGGDLADLIQTSKLPVEDIIRYGIDLADALTRAHKLDIIHRDLKPANILIATDGTLCLTDFGIAQLGSKNRVTDTDAIMGTIDYLPPEAFDGNGIDTRSDIWAFGVILFEMLSGQRPFTGQTLIETIQQITTAPIPDLESYNPDAPVALVDLVYRMLERNPQARIASVRHIGAELEDILHGRDRIIHTKRFDTHESDIINQPKHNLKAQATPFVGRSHELNELKELLENPDNRLITILAQGGMGKTRLAMALAESIVNEKQYQDGVYVVELASLSSAEDISDAIADACSFQFLGEGTSKQQLLTILHERRMLLVLDNFEHLPDGFTLVSEILQSASNITIIVTSRQRLSQQGETLYHLSGMAFPEFETPKDALEYPAVNLFVNSAQRAYPAFKLTDNNLQVVATICQLVQGMPLALVLSGSWMSTLSIDDIASEIKTGLDFLETEETDLPARQRSIRAVMDYSWQQMTIQEQTVFMKLSMFRSDFTREAANHIAGANLRILMRLVNISVIHRNTTNGRYRIHELLRQYAEEYLLATQSKHLFEVDYINYFTNLLQECAIDIKGRQQVQGLNAVETDIENIRLAWDLAVRAEDIDSVKKMAEALTLFYYIRSNHQQVQLMIEHAIKSLAHIQSPKWNVLCGYWLFGYYSLLGEKTLDNEHPTYMALSEYLKLSEQDPNQKNNRLHLILESLHLNNQPTEFKIKYIISKLKSFQKVVEKFYLHLVLHRLHNLHLNILPSGQESFRQINDQLLTSAKENSDYNALAEALYYKGIVAGYFGQENEGLSYLQQAQSYSKMIGNTRSYAVSTSPYAFQSLMLGDMEETIDQVEILMSTGLDTNFEWVYYQGLTIRAFINGLQGHYDLARDLANKVLAPESVTSIFLNHTAWRALCLSSIGFKDWNRATEQLLMGLRYLHNHYNEAETLQWLPLAAIILAKQDHTSQAIQLFSLAYHHIETTTGWIKSWGLFEALQQELRIIVGEAIYLSTWEQGKTLNVESVLENLIRDFGD